MTERVFQTRPWTQTLLSQAKLQRTSRIEIKTPVINTYAKQLQQCSRLYDKVTKANRRSEEDRLPKIQTTDKPRGEPWHTLSKSAPGTFYIGQNSEDKISQSLTNYFREKRHNTEQFYRTKGDNENTEENQSDSDTSDNVEVNPYHLCEILHRRGIKKPLIVLLDKNGKAITQSKSRHRRVRKNTGALPKNPTIREKIKGRARLDYEMANMRAEAFCERQAQRKFRTASAITRNRDVEFVEEDFLERIKQENNDDKNNDDDTGSIVMSIDKEELFKRINEWIIDVNKALNDPVQSHST